MNDGLSEDKADAFAQQLHEETQQERQQEEQKQSELLDAVAQDDDLGGTDTARFGDAEVVHKTWLPGDKIDELRRAYQQMGDDRDGELTDGTDILVDITESVRNVRTDEVMTDDALIESFYEDMIERYGIDGIKLINDRVLGPVLEETKTKVDALQSFPESGSGDGNGDGTGAGGDAPEDLPESPGH